MNITRDLYFISKLAVFIKSYFHSCRFREMSKCPTSPSLTVQQVLIPFVKIDYKNQSPNPLQNSILFESHFSEGVLYEVYLALFLLSSLCAQYVFIYDKNIFLIDFDLPLLLAIVIFRRMLWNLANFSFEDLRECSSVFFTFQSFRFTFLSLSIILCAMFIIRVSLPLSISQILSLFYPVLLYLSFFGYSTDPRDLRSRYQYGMDLFSILNVSPPKYLRSELTKHYSDNYELLHPLLGLMDASVLTQEIILISSDLFIRLKQLFFNMLLSTYLIGVLPLLLSHQSISPCYKLCALHVLCFYCISGILFTRHYFPKHYIVIMYDLFRASKILHHTTQTNKLSLFLRFRLFIFDYIASKPYFFSNLLLPLMITVLTLMLFIIYSCISLLHHIVIFFVILHGIYVLTLLIRDKYDPEIHPNVNTRQ